MAYEIGFTDNSTKLAHYAFLDKIHDLAVANGWTVLLPITRHTPVASSKQQLEIQVKNARYCRLNNIDQRTVITAGR